MEPTDEVLIKLAQLTLKRENVINQRKKIITRLSADASTINACRLIVPGIVYPGVEVSIGSYFRLIDREYRNVVFHLVNNEIASEPISAMQPTL